LTLVVNCDAQVVVIRFRLGLDFIRAPDLIDPYAQFEVIFFRLFLIIYPSRSQRKIIVIVQGSSVRETVIVESVVGGGNGKGTRNRGLGQGTKCLAYIWKSREGSLVEVI
jgi:hypothetical protein